MVMVVMEESLQDVPGKCISKLRLGPREYPGYILEHMEEGNLPCDGLETSREQADVMLDSFICYTTTRRCPRGGKKKVQMSGHIGQAWKGEKRGRGPTGFIFKARARYGEPGEISLAQREIHFE